MIDTVFSHKFYDFLDKPKWVNPNIFYALSNPYTCFVSCYLNYIWDNLWNLIIIVKKLAGCEEKFVTLTVFLFSVVTTKDMSPFAIAVWQYSLLNSQTT
jgi:hypothetical protein